MTTETRRVTVTEAAIIAHRSPRTIYDWIEQELLETFQGDAGEILVDGVAVLVVEESRKRGRPRSVKAGGE